MLGSDPVCLAVRICFVKRSRLRVDPVDRILFQPLHRQSQVRVACRDTGFRSGNLSLRLSALASKPHNIAHAKGRRLTQRVAEIRGMQRALGQIVNTELTRRM